MLPWIGPSQTLPYFHLQQKCHNVARSSFSTQRKLPPPILNIFTTHKFFDHTKPSKPNLLSLPTMNRMLFKCLSWKRRKSSKIKTPTRMGSLDTARLFASREASAKSMCSTTHNIDDELMIEERPRDGHGPIRPLEERSSSLFSMQARMDRREANRNRARALFSQVDQQMEIERKFNGRRPSYGIIDKSWYCSR